MNDIEEEKDIDKIIDCILEIWKSAGKNPVFLTGAGTSLSAGVPLWNELKNTLLEDMYNLPAQQAEEKFRNNYPEFTVKTFLPESVCAQYVRAYSLKRLAAVLSRYCSVNGTSASYEALSQLAKVGFYTFYLTLNFDGLFERNIMRSGLTEYFLLNNERDFEESYNRLENGEVIPLICANLHGTFHLPHTLITTIDEVLNPIPLESPKGKFVQSAIKNSGCLIIIGYGAADNDVWPLVEKILIDQKKLKIYWIDNREPSRIKELKEKQLEARWVQTTSDVFLTTLLQEVKKIIKVGNRPSEVSGFNVIKDWSQEKGLFFSSPGSVILAGDYGCYINGEMVNLTIPLRTYVKVEKVKSVKGGKIDMKCFSYDPFLNEWRNSSNIEGRVKQVWEFINIVADSRNAKYVEESGDYLAKYISDWKGLTPKQWKDSFSMSDRFKFAIATLFQGNRLTKQDTEPFSLLKNYSLDITVYSEFEEGVGLGDNVHSTIISAICALLLKESKRISEIEQIMRNSSFCRLIINLSQAFWWAAGYPDASWLRLVPCFVPWRFQPICIFNRQEEEIRLKGQVFDFFPDDKIGEYYIPNIQIKMEEIIRTFEKFKLRGANDCIGDNVDFAIAYMPRTLLPEARETPPTEAGVGGVLPEDRPIMEALSKITQEIYLELTSKLDWTRVGKLMNAYHFTLSGMRRASRKANELVGALCGVEGVLGAKTSGAGPGGGFVVLYEKKLVNFEKLADIIEKGEHKILTLKLGSRKHLLHPMTSDLSFLSVGVDL